MHVQTEGMDGGRLGDCLPQDSFLILLQPLKHLTASAVAPGFSSPVVDTWEPHILDGVTTGCKPTGPNSPLGRGLPSRGPEAHGSLRMSEK